MNLLKNGLLLTLLLLITCYGCRKDLAPIEDYYEYVDIHDYAVDILEFARYDTIAGGIYLKVTKEGEGPVPVKNEKIYTYYNGLLLTGKQFDSKEMLVIASDGKDSIQTPYSFTLGAGAVIAGWDSAFTHLKRGSEAIMLIPSGMAYGSQNRSGIPPNSPLRFDVKLLWLKGDPGTDPNKNTPSDPDGTIAKMLNLMGELN